MVNAVTAEISLSRPVNLETTDDMLRPLSDHE